MIIRPATTTDLPQLIVLLQQALAGQGQLAPFVTLMPGLDWQGMAQAKLQNPYEQVLVAEWEAQVVGYINVRVSSPPLQHWWRRLLQRCRSSRRPPAIIQPRRVGWIEDCYVMPEARRQGIGGALVHAALAWIHTQQVQRVELGVFTANREALAFWEQQGFTSFRLLMAREIA